MTRYFDSSALVTFLVEEPGTPFVRRLMASGTAATSRLSEVELTSAVARRLREGTVPRAHGERLTVNVHAAIQEMAVVELTPEVVFSARGLLLRHALRAGDAVQLASATWLQAQLGQPVPFVAFDQALVRVARAEGLTVIDSVK